ncbi:MAG TPA: BatA domain-containing protein [Bryobacteraceae bacterium]|nr:BatA domain-containing protein [Bryobacteraceae bacterium]
MGFFSPWFLGGILAVGLPVWLHLLKRHRSTPQPFSSLMFFEQHIQSSIKHKRLRYLLLFALRTALLALIALAFAKPYIRQQALPQNRAGEVALIAVDNSMSMSADGRLDRAKQAAKSAIGSLGPGHRAEVVAFGARLQAMTELTDDHSALNAGVDAIDPSDARTSFAELARASRSIAQTLRLPVNVELFSDMQQTGMPPNFNDLRLNENIRLEPHPIGGAAPNFTVENVVAPSRVYDAKKQRVLATVAGFGTKKADRQVSLLLNGRVVETKTVTVPEGGRATAEFLSLDVPHGQNKGEVRIDSGDALPQDDHFYFSIERVEPRHALFVHEPGNNQGLLYFNAALEASGQSAFLIDPATTDQVANVAPEHYAFVVLSDVGALPAAFENALKNYAHAGGSVFVALGHNSAAASHVPVADVRFEDTRYAGREGDRFQTVAWLDASHPAILNDNRWDGVKFYQAIRVNPGAARVVVRLSDQTPLLLDEQAGQGRILVFTSTFDNVANDFPLHPSFVPFIEQASRYLGRLDAGPAGVTVGSYAELRDPKATGSSVEVIDPHGKSALSLGEGANAQNIQFSEAGFYEIHRATGPETVAVNADRRESDLAAAPKDTLTLWENTAKGTSGPTGAAESGERDVSLWWYVMIVVLALAFAESLLGNQHLSVNKEAA